MMDGGDRAGPLSKTVEGSFVRPWSIRNEAEGSYSGSDRACICRKEEEEEGSLWCVVFVEFVVHVRWLPTGTGKGEYDETVEDGCSGDDNDAFFCDIFCAS